MSGASMATVFTLLHNYEEYGDEVSVHNGRIVLIAAGKKRTTGYRHDTADGMCGGREDICAMGLPFLNRPYDAEEEFDPYVYDGSMGIRDMQLMHHLMGKDPTVASRGMPQGRYEQMDMFQYLRMGDTWG